MSSVLSSGLTPIILVVRDDEKIVGVATFVLKRAARARAHYPKELKLRTSGFN